MREYFGSPYFDQFLFLLLLYIGLFVLALITAQVVLRRPGAGNPFKGAYNFWILVFGIHFLVSAIMTAFSLQAMVAIPEPWHRMLGFSAPLLVLVLVSLGLFVNLILGVRRIRR